VSIRTIPKKKDDIALDSEVAGILPVANGGTNRTSGTPLFKSDEITETCFIPVAWGIDGTAAPDAKETLTSTNKVDVRQFAGSVANQDMFIPWLAPPDIKAADGIKFKVICIVSAATGPSNEGVAFGLKGASVASGEALGASLGTAAISSITALTESQYDIVITALSAAITVTGLATSELVMFNFYRAQDHNDDTYGQKIGVIGIELQYTRLLS
jgi:hypothetical protein